MINVRSVDHVVLRVADVDKVSAFYIDVLGGSGTAAATTSACITFASAT